MVVMARADDVLTPVHPGRHVEVFREPIRAGELMRRYPRHCIARPDVFEFPWIAVHPQAVLPRGRVFFLVPYHTIHALLTSTQQRQQQQGHAVQSNPNGGSLYGIIRRLLMRRNVNEGEEESSHYRDESTVGDSRPRPRVSSGEVTELLRMKPCLRRPDSERRRLGLRVSFC